MDQLGESSKSRLVTLLREAGQARDSTMALGRVQHCYGPVFNAPVSITNVTVNGGTPRIEGRRELVQAILTHVNGNRLQEWLGEFLHEQFSASGLIDLSDSEIFALHSAVVARTT